MFNLSKRFFSILVIFGSLFLVTNQYLEFQLIRIPSQQNSLNHHVKSQCIADQKSVQSSDYKEICYEKDIVYAIELYNQNKELFMLSLDLTLPISWIKSDQCVSVDPSTKQTSPCSRIQVNFKDKVKKLKNKMKDKIFKKKKISAQTSAATEAETLVTIDGSSETVKGSVQKVDNMQFWTRDSGRLSRITDLLLLGFYVLGEKDQLILKDTNFIKASQISYNLNYLCDGAISLRFDQASEKSFLNSILNYVQAGNGMNQSIITIYLGKQHKRNNTLTIGELSVKNSQGGFSAINWVNTSIDEDYGHVPQLNNIYFGDHQDHQKMKEISITQVYAIFTLSASYISVPDKILQDIFANIKPYADCSINAQTLNAQCVGKKKIFLEKEIVFDFGTGMISFSIKDLVASSQKKNLTLHLRKGIHDGYVVFGQPVFKKYFMLFDFTKERIGIAPQRVSWTESLINVISLIRFVSFTFCTGCCIIICFRPIKKMCDTFSSANRGFKGTGPQGRRLRQYSPIQENPYQDIKEKISQAMKSNREMEDAEGI